MAYEPLDVTDFDKTNPFDVEKIRHLEGGIQENEQAIAEVNADLKDKVGDGVFQLRSANGTAIQSGDDINKLLTVGNYYVTNNATAAGIINLPSSNGGMLKVLEPLGNSNYMIQIYLTYTLDIYLRRYVSGYAQNDGWYDWYAVPVSLANTTSIKQTSEDESPAYAVELGDIDA